MQNVPTTDPRAIKLACKALTCAELVIYPTETCYGIAADAKNPQAVTKLLAYKGDRHRQVAVAVANRSMAEQYVKLNPLANNLYTHFLPGPITVISTSLHQLDERLESSQGGLGIRIPRHDFALSLLRAFGHPITATSANTSGKKEPYSLADWQKYTTPEKQNMVSLFLDAGRLAERPTSTVVNTTLNDPTILRQGGLVIPTLSPSLTSHSVKETISIAGGVLTKYLTLTRRFPLIIALQGELGVGKTQFVKGIATTLGIDLNVSSPTYTIMKEYPYMIPAAKGSDLPPGTVPNATKGSDLKGSAQPRIYKRRGRSDPKVDFKYSGVLYHIDTWRLADSTELESTLHLSRLLKPGNIVAIEWAGKAQELLQAYEKDIPILVINIKEINVSTRQITYAFTTPEWS